MKAICPACGMVQTTTTGLCPKCNTKTVSKGRRIVFKDSRVKVGPKEGSGNG